MLFANHINKQVEKGLYDPPAQQIDYAENKKPHAASVEG
jgi:hypothetical protein